MCQLCQSHYRAFSVFQSLSQGGAKGGHHLSANVHFADTQFDSSPKVIIGNPGTTVEHQGNRYRLIDGRKPLKIQLGCICVKTVGIANGYSQGIYLGWAIKSRLVCLSSDPLAPSPRAATPTCPSSASTETPQMSNPVTLW